MTGFSALSYQLKYHGAFLQQIVDRLGQIAKNIANPLATQANELVRSGQHLMERGLYREAYADLIAAESKRSVNPMLQVYLTQLLYKVRDEGVPFDLAGAEQHAGLAIRYATSLREDLADEGPAVIDLVFRTAAHLAMIKGGDLTKASRSEAGTVELRRADGYLRQIDQPSASSRFLHAQVLALLERRKESITTIRLIADFTRSWIPRALLEPNLGAIADGVRALEEDLRLTPEVHSKNVYRAIRIGREFVALCSSMKVTSANVKKLSSAAADLSLQILAFEHDFDAGAINAISAVKSLTGALDSAKKGTLSVLAASRDELDVELNQAEKTASLHEARIRDMLADEHRVLDRHNIGAFSLWGLLLGWVLGVVSCKAGISKSCGEIFIAGPAGAAILPILSLLWTAASNFLKHLENRTLIPAEEASATSARAQAIEITRRIDDLKRMSKAVTAS